MIDPAESAFEITPNDNADLAHVTRGLYVGVIGDVSVITANGDTVTFVAVAAGIVHPLQIRKVFASGTDATDIVGVY